MRRALAILVVALLAGCNAPDGDDARPTPRVVSRAPTPEAPALLRLVSLNVTPVEIELGATVVLHARVANEGGSAAEPELTFEIAGGPTMPVTIRVVPGTVGDAEGDLTPTSGGNLSARVRLGGQELTAALLVRAPRIANLTVQAAATEPCGALRLTIGFDNVGDATARGVRADLDVMDEAGAPIVSRASSIGDVPAGGRGEATVDVPEASAACEGEEPRVYGVRLVVHTDHLADVQLTGVVTA